MRVALYARVSTADKDQNPETQLRPLREHLAALAHKADVEPAGEFVDRASADDLRSRRAWRTLLELAHHRRADLVVVWKLDRAFRSVLDGATTLQALRTAGCGIRSLQEPWIDTTTPIGEALYHITLAWAQLEQRQLAERVRAGMARARAEGKAVGRPPRAQPVTAHPQWSVVLAALAAGHLTRAEAAKKLRVRKAALIAALAASAPAERPAGAFPKGGRPGGRSPLLGGAG